MNLLFLFKASGTESATSSSSQSRRSPPHEQPSPRPCASGYSPRSPRPGKPTSSHQNSPGSSPIHQNDTGNTQNINTRCSSARKQDIDQCGGEYEGNCNFLIIISHFSEENEGDNVCGLSCLSSQFSSFTYDRLRMTVCRNSEEKLCF